MLNDEIENKIQLKNKSNQPELTCQTLIMRQE
jgi:hypothetical protein